MFDQQQIKDAVNKALASSMVPVGAKGAFVAIADNTGVTLVVAAKLGDGSWEIGANAHMDMKHNLEYGATVHKTW
jgi:hypothetical protein